MIDRCVTAPGAVVHFTLPINTTSFEWLMMSAQFYTLVLTLKLIKINFGFLKMFPIETLLTFVISFVQFIFPRCSLMVNILAGGTKH